MVILITGSMPAYCFQMHHEKALIAIWLAITFLASLFRQKPVLHSQGSKGIDFMDATYITEIYFNESDEYESLHL